MFNSNSCYINPNIRSMTSNIQNTAPKSGECFGIMPDRLKPVEDLEKVLRNPIKLARSTSIDRSTNSFNIASGAVIPVNNGYVLKVKPQGIEVSGGDNSYSQEEYIEAQAMASALGTLLRNAGGTMNIVANGDKEFQQWTMNVAKVLKYIGLDPNKNFTINGIKYSKNKNNYFESERNAVAQEAYEQLKMNNQTWKFADERTKKQTSYISDYYLSSLPENVKDSWWQTVEETGINPFPSGYNSTLTWLAMEQDFQTNGNDNLLGNSTESALDAVSKILERLDSRIVSEENRTFIQREKAFYTTLANKLKQYN